MVAPQLRRRCPSTAAYGRQARRNTLRIDRATATAIPGSTPSRATAEERRDRQRELGLALLPQPHGAGHVGERDGGGDHDRGQRGLGQVPEQPGQDDDRQRRSARRRRAPVSWLRAPARSATAVRDPLVLTGKPWKSPAARFAAPIPIISWLPSTSCPVRAANADDVEIVSASDTSAMPERPGGERAEVGQLGRGDGQRRESLREHPDQRDPAGGQVEDRGGGDGEHDHDEHRRHLGQPPLQHQDDDDARDPEHRRGRDRLAVGQAAARRPPASAISPSASTLKPNSFGSCPTRMVTRQAVHVADHGGLGEQVGDEAEPRQRRRRS